ncbi:MAG: hypothetical protein H6624_12215 [Bdellovibrionaceae bacterium]|nr:hypothetical protein [Bdellovibrionales bacterium]MCB9085107.1 hypothetical protein [Pseudobdellovibrionaceae bacterium]
MKTAIRWVIRELRLHKRLSLLFIINVSLGLSGFIALDSFRHSIDRSLSDRSRAVLGADFGISSRKPIPEKTMKALEELAGQDKPPSQMTELYSMVATTKGDSRLAQIRAIDPYYPFYGHLELRRSGLVTSGKARAIHHGRVAWVYPEILLQMDSKIGDTLKIGQLDFVIDDVIEEDAAAGISTSMAPRIYIDSEHLSETQLITSESLAWYSSLYHFPLKSDDELDELERLLQGHPSTPEGIRVYSHRGSSEQLGRMLNYLSDYLGLVALAALFLSGVGSVFLFRSYFNSKIYQIAILLSLGMTPFRAIIMVLTQVAVLGLLGALPSVVLGLMIVPAIAQITKQLLPVALDVHIPMSSPLLALALGFFGSIIVCFPIAVQIFNLKPALLFRGANKEGGVSGRVALAASLPALFSFWALAVWQAHSWLVGSLFVGLFLGAGLLLAAIGFALLRLIDHSAHQLPRLPRLALRDLARHPVPSLTGFLALGLGILLLNLVPQIQKSLEGELEHPGQSRLPSLFLFDIQEEQLSKLEEIVENNGSRLQQVSPLVRARLSKVNDLEFKKETSGSGFTREEEREARFRNRGFNLTYRDHLSDSESIISGQDFSGPYQNGAGLVPEISLEKRFADRLGLKVGDVLTFDIQSVPISGKVISLRSVKWTSFQPNFFVLFQSGVLDPAPKTFLATLPGMSIEKRASLQNKIVAALPNVSLIDVSRLVARLLAITRQMSWALQFMAFLCLAAGFVVLYSISSHQIQTRRWEMSLLKVLGGEESFVRRFFVVQFGVIAAASGFLGVAISLGVSLALSRILFDSLWVWQWQIPLLSLIGLIALSWLVTSLASRRILAQKPSGLLREGTPL